MQEHALTIIFDFLMYLLDSLFIPKVARRAKQNLDTHVNCCFKTLLIVNTEGPLQSAPFPKGL